MENLPDQDLFEEISNQSAYGAAIVSPDGQWLHVNAYLCAMLGYEEHELLAMTFQQITHSEDLESEKPYLERLAAGTIDHYRFRKRYLHKGGQIVWGLLDRSVARDAEHQPLYFISHIQDITAERLAEPQPGFFSRLAARLRLVLHKS